MDVKARSSIELHLADNVMFNVDGDINAKETCDKFEKVYRELCCKLLKVDVKYEDDDNALLLLRSLPPSFKHFRTTIMFSKESLKLDEVMEAIQSYVKMDENTEGSQAYGLYVKGKERGRS
ncbi:hypothetical protein LWI28_016448 [Acer negundo]|uniref:Uncharacterized protein n=1 Tax=Acer negundo TaxID=4023 RepID=A0AAD5JHY5_ACENE|nr:hypothetical protein LWI28_016448 [Acer negundo]